VIVIFVSIDVSPPTILSIIRIGIKPFNESPSNVKNAAFLLPVLRTFVAPGLLDPYVLGSGRFIILLVIMANGIEPIRYNKTHIGHSSGTTSIVNWRKFSYI